MSKNALNKSQCLYSFFFVVVFYWGQTKGESETSCSHGVSVHVHRVKNIGKNWRLQWLAKSATPPLIINTSISCNHNLFTTTNLQTKHCDKLLQVFIKLLNKCLCITDIIKTIWFDPHCLTSTVSKCP